MRDVCIRTELCTRCACWGRNENVLMLRVENCECAACAGTDAVDAYTKRNIEIPFPSTQIFVRTWNKKFPKQMSHELCAQVTGEKLY